MTGPTAVQVTPADPAASAPVGRSDGAPVSPEEFVRLLAQLLHGTRAAAPEQLGQKIGEAPPELESESPRKPEAPTTEQNTAGPLAALGVELVPVAPPPPPPPPPAGQDPGLGSAHQAGAEPSATQEGSARLSKPTQRPAQLELRDVPVTGSEMSPEPKAASSSLHAPANPVPEIVSPPARAEEPRSPTAGTHAVQTGSDARPELTLGVGTADTGGFHGSPDGERGSDRGRSEREAGNGIVGAGGPPAASAQPVPDSTDASTRASSAASPRPAVEQVAERVGLAHREGREEVSFRLEPPELGAVRIQAVLEGQRLTLHIRTEHEAARLALEQSMPQLKESLSQQGIVAGRVTVELGLDTSARGFSGQDFAGSPRHEPADPPVRSSVVSVRSGQWIEPDRQGVDLWV